jgi:hypothetical protein
MCSAPATFVIPDRINADPYQFVDVLCFIEPDAGLPSGDYLPVCQNARCADQRPADNSLVRGLVGSEKSTLIHRPERQNPTAKSAIRFPRC